MKNLIVLLLSACYLWSCNPNRYPENKEPANLHETDQHHQHHDTDHLTRNNGVKWKAGDATGNNVDELKMVIQLFNDTQDKTLPGYQKTAIGLQKGIDRLISECRIKGADHVALHKWLQPLLKLVSEFKESATTDAADEKLERISQQINIYHQYFE